MPVAPVLGDLERHDDEVGEADGDLLVAARAEIGLARLEGMDERNLEVVVVRYPRRAHSRSKTHTAKAAATSA
jgi:hypothetical protein